MFTLRTVIPDTGIEKNQFLGENYSLIKSKAKNFKDIFAAYYQVEVYENDSKEVFHEGDPNCPIHGRGITGDLEYDKKFFWVDAKYAFERGYRYIFANNKMYFLESATASVPSDIARTYAFVSVGEDKIYPVLSGDWNYIVSENGNTYSNISSFK